MSRAVAVAAVALVALISASTAVPAQTRTLLIFAPRGTSNNCARVLPLKRIVPGPRLLRGAMQALLAGPTKTERARGYGGWFSTKTAGQLRSARIEHGVAYIDFASLTARIPSAATSCGSTLLLAQLDRTAKQFPTVKRTVYSFNGSRRAFYEWLQRTAPEGAQDASERMVAAITHRAPEEA